MKIFISWSGERSLGLAEALKSWLPLVLHYVDPWLSKADIDAGKRWDDELSKTLSECNFGISCVTAENLTAPWLLFEAGALAKSVEEGHLVPLLLGLEMKNFSGPLSRFQAKKVDRAGVAEILEAINKASATPIPDQRLHDLLELAWDKLEERIEAIPSSPSSVKPTRNQSDILEELVAGVRSVEARVRDMSDDEPTRVRRKRYYPPMVMEIIHILGFRSADPMQLIIIASFFRESAPWLYEIGAQAYSAIVARNIRESRRLLETFQRGVDMLIHGPFSREFGVDRDFIRMLASETGLFDGEFAERFLPRKRTKNASEGAQLAADKLLP